MKSFIIISLGLFSCFNLLAQTAEIDSLEKKRNQLIEDYKQIEYEKNIISNFLNNSTYRKQDFKIQLTRLNLGYELITLKYFNPQIYFVYKKRDFYTVSDVINFQNYQLYKNKVFPFTKTLYEESYIGLNHGIVHHFKNFYSYGFNFLNAFCYNEKIYFNELMFNLGLNNYPQPFLELTLGLGVKTLYSKNNLILYPGFNIDLILNIFVSKRLIKQ